MNSHHSAGGALYIVSIPIGNLRDVTLRALDVLTAADGIIVESVRLASTIFKRLGLPEKENYLLEEHEKENQTTRIIQLLLMGKQLALISDCGTPAFEDPGNLLIARCLENRIRVSPIPGPSSLMAALSLSPIPLKEFLFMGFLPQKTPERDKKFQIIKKTKIPIILMDTPYRLSRLMREVYDQLGENRLVTLAVDLTMPTELLLHGKAREVANQVKDRKGEFVLIIHTIYPCNLR